MVFLLLGGKLWEGLGGGGGVHRNLTAKLGTALCQWECVGGFQSSPENPSPSQSPGLLTCCRAKFLGNVLDSKVDSLIEDHSSQVEYLHLIKQWDSSHRGKEQRSPWPQRKKRRASQHAPSNEY